MIPLKIDGQTYFCPTSWADITLKQWYKLNDWYASEDKDIIALYAMLLDMDYDTMYKCRQLDVSALIEPNIQFLVKIPNMDKLPMPDVVNIAGKAIVIGDDLGVKSYGQMMFAQKLLNEINEREISENEKAYEQIITACMIYLYPDEKFDMSKAQKRRKYIENSPVMQLYPVAAFFFRKLNASQSYKKNSLTLRRRTMHAWQRWKSSIGIRFGRLMRLRGETS